MQVRSRVPDSLEHGALGGPARMAGGQEPWRLLRGCLSTGQVTDMEFDHLMLGSRDVVGPVAALRGSLRRAGCMLLMGPRLRDPLGNVLAVRAPSYHVRWFLYEGPSG